MARRSAPVRGAVRLALGAAWGTAPAKGCSGVCAPRCAGPTRRLALLTRDSDATSAGLPGPGTRGSRLSVYTSMAPIAEDKPNVK